MVSGIDLAISSIIYCAHSLIQFLHNYRVDEVILERLHLIQLLLERNKHYSLIYLSFLKIIGKYRLQMDMVKFASESMYKNYRYRALRTEFRSVLAQLAFAYSVRRKKQSPTLKLRSTYQFRQHWYRL